MSTLLECVESFSNASLQSVSVRKKKKKKRVMQRVGEIFHQPVEH